MVINENTKIFGRFHKAASARGLNIYNPFFEEQQLNSLYVLFQNENPLSLVEGMRNLNLSGAITAGFESDPVLPTLLDDLDDVSRFVNRVGFVTNDNGHLVGRSQGGKGMLRNILHTTQIEGKTISLVGAGTIAKGLLFMLEKEKINTEITIFNRTLENAQKLKDRFPFIKSVKPLNELESSSGDVFVNVSDIGGSVTDFIFSENAIANHDSIVDITFEIENTPLVMEAKRMGKNVGTGWDMFAFQMQVIVEEFFHREFDFDSIKKHVVKGLSTIVT